MTLTPSERTIALNAETNIKTIQMVYEAFGRGDVDAILANVTDDVDWASEASGNGAPWYGPHRGPGEVGHFFAAFGSTMDVEDFTPITLVGDDRDVLTVVHIAGTARSSGRRIEMELHHYFRFRDGKIAYYRGTEDTAQTEAALRS
jgi:ketosteroid isomerase-like protein